VAVHPQAQRLDALQDKTDNLAISAQGFRRGANRVRKQMWWKDMKMRVCIIVGIIVLLLIIIVPTGTLPWTPTRIQKTCIANSATLSHCYTINDPHTISWGILLSQRPG
jgi:hypothetical protein